MPSDALMMIELDEQLYDYLRNRFPGVRVVHGDATKLSEIVAEQEIEQVSTVVSGLPMVNMPFDFQQAIVQESMKSLKPDGYMLQYSYSPISPIPAKKLGVKAEIVRFRTPQCASGDGLALQAFGRRRARLGVAGERRSVSSRGVRCLPRGLKVVADRWGIC